MSGAHSWGWDKWRGHGHWDGASALLEGPPEVARLAEGTWRCCLPRGVLVTAAATAPPPRVLPCCISAGIIGQACHGGGRLLGRGATDWLLPRPVQIVQVTPGAVEGPHSGQCLPLRLMS